MSIGENIRNQRIAHNLSQEELSEILDVSRQSISKWENDLAVPDLDKLKKLSQRFGVSIDLLVDNEQSSTPESSPAHAATPRKFLTRQTVGIALFCFAAISFLLLSIINNPSSGVYLALPFALCGVSCFVFSKHTGVFCAWALYFGFFFSYLNTSGSFRMFALALPRLGSINYVLLLIQISLLAYTVYDYRMDNMEFSAKQKNLFWAGAVLWALYFILRVWATFSGDESSGSLVTILNQAHLGLLAWLSATALRIRKP